MKTVYIVTKTITEHENEYHVKDQYLNVFLTIEDATKFIHRIRQRILYDSMTLNGDLSNTLTVVNNKMHGRCYFAYHVTNPIYNIDRFVYYNVQKVYFKED